jgi:hypothetical protein
LHVRHNRRAPIAVLVGAAGFGPDAGALSAAAGSPAPGAAVGLIGAVTTWVFGVVGLRRIERILAACSWQHRRFKLGPCQADLDFSGNASPCSPSEAVRV